LRTVKNNIDRKKYSCQQECAADIRLIWSNAMLYNAPSSKVYLTAKILSEQFESLYANIAEDDNERPPNAEELTSLGLNMFKLSPDELGKMVVHIDANCPLALIKHIDLNEVEINIDLIPAAIFHELNAIMAQYLPGKTCI